MSNFMKAVVEEVLNGKKLNTQQKRNPSPTHSASSNENNHDTLHHLIRPNYQNRNMEKRLSFLDSQPRTEKIEHSQVTKVTKQPNVLLGSPISQLKKISLSNGISQPKEARIDPPSKTEHARLIGSTKDGTFIWFFPSVHPNLSQMFQRTTSGYSVAVINSKICYPSQLLLLNEWLNIYPELKYHLIWNKAHHHPFTLELYDVNENRLEKVAKEIYQHLVKRSETKVETYQLISPSAWLSKQLGIMKSVESVGILEGLSYFHNLLVLDHFYKSEPSYPLSIQLEQHFLITTGKTESMKEALAKLKKIADQM